ncbi:DUF4062 domain-containing protein [Agromyces intestinalis]|uniref:DUF4062 domain-containing protein n=1 Tax=Agromyces intestinalis TaxID=2592652 RepID=A0A5C1YG72_9MICO|nr:DUF4062 domain-containing protein [Agromyces intestinalis]QEO13742.1 DUF4062 domain-containing protein [Agromyces intestinalis]
MNPARASIRTPDQRLRVFVSSTLRELAPERRAVRRAIEELRLAPVMFELGARPHPPRELYRAYLEQSDIFVGLYAERYGWVAPGEEISGLEDEYRLAPRDMPKLVYVKEAAEREPRLVELLDRIRDDDGAAYVYFADEDELAELVRGDLATLLAERFATAAAREPVWPSTGEPLVVETGHVTPPPVPLSEMIGRERELARVLDLLRGSARFITVTGPAGIGKSLLALVVAHEVRDDFADGVAFVDLAAVTAPDRVTAAIAAAIGVHDTGEGDFDRKLQVALRGRRMLLLVDNFEQVIDAGTVLRDLLEELPDISLLVTSRSLLRVSGEHGVELGPLPLPDPSRIVDRPTELQAASVRLFVDRVRTVKPDFELTAENAIDVARVCVALDGVPLAIELAAARARVLPPAELLERLRKRLPMLTDGSRDLPERHRTMRGAIEWSIQLVPESAQLLFARLGVFAGAFSLEAAEAIARPSPGAAGAGDGDVVVDLEALVDASILHQRERGDRAVYMMLGAVREVAHEHLLELPDARAVHDRYAAWFIALSEEAEYALEGVSQQTWVDRLNDDADNLRAVMRHLLDTRQWSAAAHFAWMLYLYWWVGGHLGEARAWMNEVLDSGEPLDRLTEATALYFTRAIAFWQWPDVSLIPDLRRSAEGFRASGDLPGEGLAYISLGLAQLAALTPPDPVGAAESLERALASMREAGDTWGEGHALVTIGRIELLQGHYDSALERFASSLDIAQRRGDRHAEAIAQYHVGWVRLLLGQADEARRRFEINLDLSCRLAHDEGIAYGLEGLTAVAAEEGDAPRAGLLMGAAEVLRERTGLYNMRPFIVTSPFVDRVLDGPDAIMFEAARGRGRALSTADAVAVAFQAPDGARS